MRPLQFRRFFSRVRVLARTHSPALILFFGLLGRGADVDSITPGEKLARQVCASCHLFPDPNLVDRAHWKEQILPRMEARLGVSPPDYSSSPEGELLKSLHIYPDAPALSKGDWALIVEYYLHAAPEQPIPQSTRPEISVGLKQFEVVPGRLRRDPPLTTLVRIGSKPGTVYIGDGAAKAVAALTGINTIAETLPLGNVPIWLNETPKGVYVTGIGSIAPSEHQNGALFFFERQEGKFAAPKTILKNLPRATQTEFADLNGDGKTDFVMCLFGNHRGRFSWFENKGEDQYIEHALVEKSGAIHCVLKDFNGDGTTDIGLLMAQETESFSILSNDGKGNFTNNLVFQKHPAFGHNYFETADFDGDGRDDLLVVNGDNGEYDSPLKRFHGIRLYLNKGNNLYEEELFFPLNGASKAVARDFDGDGDLDIAAIAFFPDYKNGPRESFVYLENKGGLKFSPSTFRECISGRWIVMDVGDIDGDGDLDLILGSYIHGPTSVPKFLMDTWEKQKLSVIILKNRQKP